MSWQKHTRKYFRETTPEQRAEDTQRALSKALLASTKLPWENLPKGHYW